MKVHKTSLSLTLTSLAGTALLAGAALVAGTALSGCSGPQTDAAAPPPPPEAQPAENTPVAPAEEPKKEAAISNASFGAIDGKPVTLYTLTNKNGLVAKIADYGATIIELHVPDKNGKNADIVLGFDSIEEYPEKSQYFGATIGRVANRIMDAKFKLGGKEYKLADNNKPHHLHGGTKGWDKVIWSAEPVESDAGPGLKLKYVSPDGEEAYPGTVTAMTTYTLGHDNTLRVEMEATTDKTTLVNMAHHSYWALGGHDHGTILDHELTLFADSYTPGKPMVPTGKVVPVKGTPFDFTAPKLIGKDVEKAGGDPVGFDHNWIVNGSATELRPVAKLKHPASGRVMTVEANQPGVQFYSGNFLNGMKGKGGSEYKKHAALCLESQAFPNSINVPDWQKQVILTPGVTYKHVMVHRFTSE